MSQIDKKKEVDVSIAAALLVATAGLRTRSAPDTKTPLPATTAVATAGLGTRSALVPNSSTPKTDTDVKTAAAAAAASANENKKDDQKNKKTQTKKPLSALMKAMTVMSPPEKTEAQKKMEELVKASVKFDPLKKIVNGYLVCQAHVTCDCGGVILYQRVVIVAWEPDDTKRNAYENSVCGEYSAKCIRACADIAKDHDFQFPNQLETPKNYVAEICVMHSFPPMIQPPLGPRGTTVRRVYIWKKAFIKRLRWNQSAKKWWIRKSYVTEEGIERTEELPCIMCQHFHPMQFTDKVHFCDPELNAPTPMMAPISLDQLMNKSGFINDYEED